MGAHRRRAGAAGRRRPGLPAHPAFHLEDIAGPAGLVIRPLHTPGHTPEHTSYVILAEGEPVAVFSGGSLLVASAGRPELFGPERARTLARLQYTSLHRLAALPREVGLYPTHGEGSFCSSSGAGRHTSTIGAELDANPLLAIPDSEGFADRLPATPLPIPAFYPHMAPGNTLGVAPAPRGRLPELDLDGAVHLVDIRPRTAQAAGIVPGSLGVELGDDFGSWAGWLLPYGAPVALIAERGQDVAEARAQLLRVGFDDLRGVAYDLEGLATQPYELLNLEQVTGRFPGAQILDVRMPHERSARPLPGAIERFLPELAQGAPGELDPSRPVVVACGAGRRAAIAATILIRHGLTPVVLDGAGASDLAHVSAA